MILSGPRCLGLALALLFSFFSLIDCAQAQIKHRFLGVDNADNNLLLVDQIYNKGWVVKIPAGSRDLELIGNNVLVSHGNGAAEYDVATGKKGWSISKFSDITTARTLPNGNILLGGNAPAGITIYEVDRSGKEIKKQVFNGWKELRLLRPLANGNILFTVADPYRLVEVDRSSKVVWEAKLPGKGYVGLRLPNGNTLASTGDTLTIIEIQPDGKTVFQIGGRDKHPGKGLDWFSGFEVLPNGNFLTTNWLGHEKWGTGPHVVEFDRQNNLVWQWEDHKAAKQITNVLVLDDKLAPVQNPSEISFKLSLKSGWNLISLPIQPADSSTEKVLSQIGGKFGAVYAYNSLRSSYEAYLPGEAGNDLLKLEMGRGFWVYMEEDATLDLRGTFASKAIELHEGWNLAGFNSSTVLPLESAFGSISGKVSSVYAFDTESNSYRAYEPPDTLALKSLEPGRGYWVYAEEKASWVLTR
jgi:hypothetical protein